jgi:hypothetical protein
MCHRSSARIGRALCPGQQGGAGARADDDLVLLARNVGYGERDRGVGQIENDVDALDVEPAAGDGGAHVRLVEVIGRYDLGLALRLAGEILDRELRRDNRARPLEVRIDAGHVVEDAEPKHAILFGRRRRDGENGREGRDEKSPRHHFLPGPLPRSWRDRVSVPRRLTAREGCCRQLLLSTTIPVASWAQS